MLLTIYIYTHTIYIWIRESLKNLWTTYLELKQQETTQTWTWTISVEKRRRWRVVQRLDENFYIKIFCIVNIQLVLAVSFQFLLSSLHPYVIIVRSQEPVNTHNTWLFFWDFNIFRGANNVWGLHFFLKWDYLITA